jgi:hypothetical protein
MSASLRRSPLPPSSYPSVVIGEPLANRPLRSRARITRLDRDPLDIIECYGIRCAVVWPRITLRTVARDTDSLRTISLIGRCCSKYARRIWPIRSTPIIPNPFPADIGLKEGTLTRSFRGGHYWTRKPPLRGSLLRPNLQCGRSKRLRHVLIPFVKPTQTSIRIASKVSQSQCSARIHTLPFKNA